MQSPKHLDIGMIFGTGFPPFRGGVLNYANTEGLQKIYENLSSWNEKYGKRFIVSNLIKEMARDGKKFYE
ncbi:MAG: hypothetical protein HYW47_01190 [Deltaproteobacteria bacterium]|nr:hypothetical protein [Deltaproteobacteria bacterium]